MNDRKSEVTHNCSMEPLLVLVLCASLKGADCLATNTATSGITQHAAAYHAAVMVPAKAVCRPGSHHNKPPKTCRMIHMTSVAAPHFP